MGGGYMAMGVGAVLAGLALYAWRLRRDRDALLQEKDAIFSFVHDVSEAFAEFNGAQIDFLLKRVLFYALQTTKARSGAIYFREGESETFRVRAVSGLFPPLVRGSELTLPTGDGFANAVEKLVREQKVNEGEGLIGTVAERNASLLVEDAERDPVVPRFENDFLKIRSILLVPMRFQYKVLGVIVVINRIDDAPFFQTDQNLLQSLADQASVTIYFAKFNEELDKKRVMDHDLRVARKIQSALLPSRIPILLNGELAAFSFPAREVGGDYYDFVHIDEDHVGIAIADVSGKGVTGAILMSICRSVFRAHAPGCLSPSRVLKEINSVISADIYEDMFISMLYVVLNTRTFEATLARAGHTKPFVVSSSGDRISVLESSGVAIGLSDSETFDSLLEETSFTLQPGDVWIAYTDGIVEAMNAKEEEWGISQFLQNVRAHVRAGASDIALHVRKALVDYVGETAQYDDMTLMVLYRHEGGDS